MYMKRHPLARTRRASISRIRRSVFPSLLLSFSCALVFSFSLDTLVRGTAVHEVIPSCPFAHVLVPFVPPVSGRQPTLAAAIYAATRRSILDDRPTTVPLSQDLSTIPVSEVSEARSSFSVTDPKTARLM